MLLCAQDPATETMRECFDQQDNDGDGLVDCADTDCTTGSTPQAQMIARMCASGQRPGQGGGGGGADDPNTESGRECRDQQDNDGDGTVCAHLKRVFRERVLTSRTCRWTATTPTAHPPACAEAQEAAKAAPAARPRARSPTRAASHPAPSTRRSAAAAAPRATPPAGAADTPANVAARTAAARSRQQKTRTPSPAESAGTSRTTTATARWTAKTPIAHGRRSAGAPRTGSTAPSGRLPPPHPHPAPPPRKASGCRIRARRRAPLSSLRGLPRARAAKATRRPTRPWAAAWTFLPASAPAGTSYLR